MIKQNKYLQNHQEAIKHLQKGLAERTITQSSTFLSECKSLEAYPWLTVGIFKVLNPMRTKPVHSGQVNMSLHGDFTKKTSEEDVPGVRSYVLLSLGLAQELTWY